MRAVALSRCQRAKPQPCTTKAKLSTARLMATDITKLR
jgi:hypothetical protein